jgi:hypothetical protein
MLNVTSSMISLIRKNVKRRLRENAELRELVSLLTV